MNSTLAGLSRELAAFGFECASHGQRPLEPRFPDTRLVVIPPPTGTYDEAREVWNTNTRNWFLPEEISALRRFVGAGGRLLVFGYRFGDTFTRANLRELCAAFGCLLNDDGVVDLRRLRRLYPLAGDFTTNAEGVLAPWALPGVVAVRWRCMSTFTILPGSRAFPIVVSPGGSCITYNARHRRLNFQSQPLVVGGTLGKGRFLFVGGPHAFETSELGLFHETGNQRLLRNLLAWLNDDQDDDGMRYDETAQAVAACRWRQQCTVTASSDGQAAIASVERLLRTSQTLSALSRKTWRG